MRLAPSKKYDFIYFNESPIRMIKNSFYLCYRDLFIFELFTFLSRLFDYSEKWLNVKVIVNFKFMMSQTGQQIIKIRIVPNISIGKKQSDNEIWSINAYNMSKIFLEKSYTKCGGEASPRSFYKIYQN